jgi:hypothetical protein
MPRSTVLWALLLLDLLMAGSTAARTLRTDDESDNAGSDGKGDMDEPVYQPPKEGTNPQPPRPLCWSRALESLCQPPMLFKQPA